MRIAAAGDRIPRKPTANQQQMILSKLTRKYVLSPHLALETDLADPDRIVLKNLYYGTEWSAGAEVWRLLESHARPAEPPDSKLAEQAVGHKILVPEGEPAGISPYLEELEEAIDDYLKTVLQLDDAALDRTFPRGDRQDLGSFRQALRQKVEFCARAFVGYLVVLKVRQQDTAQELPADYQPRGEGLWVWSEPEVFCAVLCDYLWLLLDEDLGAEPAGHDPALLKASLDRPPIKEHLFQQPCTVHTALRRAARVAEQCPPPARVLVLGDDDLVSLALDPGYQVDVLELDEDLVAFLKARAGSNVRILTRDLEQGLDEEFRRQYDVVISDPPYSADHIVPFLECCAQALKPVSRSRLFVSTCPALLEDGMAYHQACSDLGLQQVRATRGFNRYPVPEHFRLASYSLFVNTCRLPRRLTTTILDQPFLWADLLEYAPRLAADSALPEGMELVYSRDSRFQEIRLYRSGDALCLTNNDGIQFHSGDERASHELLVTLPLCMTDKAERVLILGGGDGLAAREALRFGTVERVVVAEIDADMIEMTRTQPDMVALTAGSLNHSRVQVQQTDALRWVQETDERFDLIVNDFDYLRTYQEGQLDPERVIQCARDQMKILRPGGCISFYVPLDPYAAEFLGCPEDKVADCFAEAFRPVLGNVLTHLHHSPYIGSHAYLYGTAGTPRLRRSPPADAVTRAQIETVLGS
ncbi:MAG: bis-aminopropyl spermidine synthase family protein [Armatimonadetes bacterium]|nr:bis-aminopropyl spermidine synthase family protein [Armatimonadota bacterium]